MNQCKCIRPGLEGCKVGETYAWESIKETEESEKKLYVVFVTEDGFKQLLVKKVFRRHFRKITSDTLSIPDISEIAATIKNQGDVS